MKMLSRGQKMVDLVNKLNGCQFPNSSEDVGIASVADLPVLQDFNNHFVNRDPVGAERTDIIHNQFSNEIIMAREISSSIRLEEQLIAASSAIEDVVVRTNCNKLPLEHVVTVEEISQLNVDCSEDLDISRKPVAPVTEDVVGSKNCNQLSIQHAIIVQEIPQLKNATCIEGLDNISRPDRPKKQKARQLLKESLNVPDDSMYLPMLSSDSDNYIPNTSSSDEDIDLCETSKPSFRRKRTRVCTPPDNKEQGIVLEEDVNNIIVKQKRRKGLNVNKDDWARSANAAKRQNGDKYLGLKKHKNGKYKLSNEKEERKLKPRCQCKKSNKGAACEKISDDVREKLFNNFWKGVDGWEAKKATVVSLVEKSAPSYRRNTTELASTRKNCSFKYFLKKGDEKIRVCKTMFLHTFSLGERSVRQWVLKCPLDRDFEKSDEENCIHDPPQSSSITSIETPSVLHEPEKKASVVSFLELLPKMESHYCRATSSLQYLQPEWESKKHLYREYLNYCKENNLLFASWTMFHQLFKIMNIGFYLPKKDQCEVCIKYKLKKVSEEDYNQHQNRKVASRMEKEIDKEQAKFNQNQIAVYEVDVQKVFTCPKIKASSSYYKTKLKVHNWCVYNLATADGSCYVWHEGNGDLGSNVFASLLVKFITKEVQMKPDLNEIIIWSDGCTYQNRCEHVSNALLHLAIKTKITVYQKYFEVGHTQMEVDSIHSTIEKKMQKHEYYVPADFIRTIKEAKTETKPYSAESLSYKDFTCYSNGYYSSIRPGTKKGDPCVTDLRCLRYQPNGYIFYKLNFSDDWMELPRRPKHTNVYNELPPLYSKPNEITNKKFKDLQELKSCIEPDYHAFYDGLKHVSCNKSPSECPHIIKN